MVNCLVDSWTQEVVEGSERFPKGHGRCPRFPTHWASHAAVVSSHVVFTEDLNIGRKAEDKYIHPFHNSNKRRGKLSKFTRCESPSPLMSNPPKHAGIANRAVGMSM